MYPSPGPLDRQKVPVVQSTGSGVKQCWCQSLHFSFAGLVTLGNSFHLLTFNFLVCEMETKMTHCKNSCENYRSYVPLSSRFMYTTAYMSPPLVCLSGIASLPCANPCSRFPSRPPHLCPRLPIVHLIA